MTSCCEQLLGGGLCNTLLHSHTDSYTYIFDMLYSTNDHNQLVAALAKYMLQPTPCLRSVTPVILVIQYCVMRMRACSALHAREVRAFQLMQQDYFRVSDTVAKLPVLGTVL